MEVGSEATSVEVGEGSAAFDGPAMTADVAVRANATATSDAANRIGVERMLLGTGVPDADVS